MEVLNTINEKIIAIKTKLEQDKSDTKDDSESASNQEPPNRGTALMDATACPQDITYPTDLNLLNDAREKSESHLMDYVEQYKSRFGCYPKDLLVDKIYSTRDNRKKLKEKGINLIGKPLGRPSLAAQIVLSPGERNPIEAKFGQAKTGYGLDRIKARLQDTSESWIASIFLVLNLVKLAGVALHCIVALLFESLSKCIIQEIEQIKNRCDLNENHTYRLALL